MSARESSNLRPALRRLDTRLALALLLAAIVAGAILVLPRFIEAAGVLAHDLGPPGPLVHREGRVVGFSDCYRPASYDGQSAMQVSLDDGRGIEIVTLPCLDDRRVLAAPPDHRLGADVDAGTVRTGRVYQATLDGRTLLSTEAVAVRRRDEMTRPALAMVGATLAALVLACFGVGVLVARMRRRA